MSEAEKRKHRLCFTGHRPEKLHSDETAVCTGVSNAIDAAISDGYRTFITGMARGVDIWAAEIVLARRAQNLDIRLICALPHPGFENRRSTEEKLRFDAIIRSAECAGAHGVIIPKRRSSGLTAVVSKSSAGALTHMAIARVPNLASAVDELKEKGVWIYAAEAGGTYYYDCDITGAVAIIMGGEDSGVSRILMDKSDFVLSIPMHGKINSLNVSAAAAVLLNEAAIQRAGVKRCK